MNPMSFRTPAVSRKFGDGVPDQFPAGLRVLVVDDDSTCLLILEKMLKNCLYEVTKCNRAEVALKLLRDNRDGYDVVISDVHMPDMDGFKLLEHVGLEMDLPVIMMSADDSKGVVMKGVTHGACDYQIKPVRMEALKNIWQHVVRKKKHELREKDHREQQSGSMEDSDRNPKMSDDTDNYLSANEGNDWKSSSRKRKEDDDDDGGDERDDTSALKKPRVVWSVELHQQFVTAVNQLGMDKAFPKKILELMNVPGLTRENVASHLQKYRIYLKRLSVGQHQNVYGNPFMSTTDPTFSSMSPLNGLDFQTMSSSSQLPPQSLATIQAARAIINRPAISGSLVDHRNIFSFENPRNVKFIDGPQQQLNNSKQVNLLHGVPTNVNLPMHPQSSQMIQPHPRNQVLNHPVHRHPMIPNMGLGRNVNDIVRSQPYASSSQPSSLNDFSSSQRMDNTTFPLMGNAAMTSTPSNYDLFDNLNQNRNVDWALQNRGPTFDPPQHTMNMQTRMDVAPSVLVQPGFSSDQRSVHIRTSPSVNNTNLGQQQLTSSTTDNSSSRIRPERLSDMGFQNSNLFPDQFGHDDLLNALLKQPEDGVAQGESDFRFDGYHLDDLPV